MLMEEPLNKLSILELRKLLIDEVKAFADAITGISPQEVQARKDRLIEINKAITEKGNQELLSSRDS